jgi:short-subunit dehydrogenase
MDKKTLAGKVSLVTGASRGIGRATALALAKKGSRVALVARNLEKLNEVAEEVRALHGEAIVFPADVSDQNQINQVVKQTANAWGRLDILVLNAGEYVRSSIRELSLEKLQRSMEVNYYSGVYFVMTALPLMLNQKNGHIVFITSMDARKGLPLDAPYVSAKAALTGFAEVLRQELYGSGVYVTTVLPGRVDTQMIENLSVPWISKKIKPEVVAEAVISAVLNRHVEVMLPFQVKLLYYVNVFWPRLADWMVRNYRLQGWEEVSEKKPGSST